MEYKHATRKKNKSIVIILLHKKAGPEVVNSQPKVKVLKKKESNTPRSRDSEYHIIKKDEGVCIYFFVLFFRG